eukprot:c39221_g1_i1 orf=118-852(+)
MALAVGIRRSNVCSLASSSMLKVAVGSIQTPHIRFFAKPPTTLAEPRKDDIVKRVFFNLAKKVRALKEELAKVKFTLDPDDSQAVAHYASTIKAIRRKVGIPNRTENVAQLLEAAAKYAPNVRAYLTTMKELRSELGIVDDMGADKLMLEAVTTVEKKIGKILTREDKKGMALLSAEFNAINAKLGLKPEKLEELESQYELSAAKAELENMKNAAVETMETFKKRDGLEKIQVDVRTLDHRNYL